METPVSNSSGIDVASDAIEPSAASNEFSVHLTNFDGPFDLLLQLISRHKLDITEISLSLVTDEFIAFIRALELSGEGWRLDQATEFLVVAATLLDLKAARLLPSGEVEDEEDLALLEARDLLFARLLLWECWQSDGRHSIKVMSELCLLRRFWVCRTRHKNFDSISPASEAVFKTCSIRPRTARTPSSCSRAAHTSPPVG